jgi:formate/nitrite transporter FocA (FNT family)
MEPPRTRDDVERRGAAAGGTREAEPSSGPRAGSGGERGGGEGGSESAKGDGDTPAVGTRLSAAEIYENVRAAAEEELERPSVALLWSALAAGLTIGFSFVGGGYASTLVAESHRTAAAAAAYPLGFILVVLARQQLFTENTLEPVIPLLNDFNRRTLLRVARLWALVLSANLVGALLFALVTARTPVVEASLLPALDAVAETATEGGFWTVGYKAVFAGWLIALMAWLVASTRATGAQILLVWLTTAPIAAFGFRHSIAGAVEAFYRVARGSASLGSMLGEFLVPAVAGNIVGGVLLVALFNHAQVAPQQSGAPAARTRDLGDTRAASA